MLSENNTPLFEDIRFWLLIFSLITLITLTGINYWVAA